MPPLSANTLGLDLGATSAWCLGQRGEKPDSGVLSLAFDVDEETIKSAAERLRADRRADEVGRDQRRLHALPMHRVRP